MTHPLGGLQSKRQTITSAGEDVRKLETSYIAGGNVKWYSYLGRQFDIFLKSKGYHMIHQFPF